MATYSGPGFVVYQGRPVLQAATISLDIQTDNKDVNTLLLGRAGHSAGPIKVQASVNGAVPSGGLEIDWPAVAVAQAQVALAFRLAGKTYNMEGDVRSVKLDTSVDKANEVSFEFHGRLVNIV